MVEATTNERSNPMANCRRSGCLSYDGRRSKGREAERVTGERSQKDEGGDRRQQPGQGDGRAEFFFESKAGYRAPLKDDIEGKSVSVSLVLLTNASRMEELQNLWNDARVVTAGIWRVPPSNRESRSLKR